MFGKISLLLTILALSLNVVSAGTQAQCGDFCTRLQASAGLAILNTYGFVGLKCYCRNAKAADSTQICVKSKTGWSILKYKTQVALTKALTDLSASFISPKPQVYDFNQIGNVGNKFSVEFPVTVANFPATFQKCNCEKKTVKYTGNTPTLYYFPQMTGQWWCVKV